MDPLPADVQEFLELRRNYLSDQELFNYLTLVFIKTTFF